MSKSRKYADEWTKACRQDMRYNNERVGVMQTEKGKLTEQTHLRKVVLAHRELALCGLGRHYHPALVSIPLSQLLDAIARDDA